MVRCGCRAALPCYVCCVTAAGELTPAAGPCPLPHCSIVYDTTAALGGALGLKAIRLSEQFVEAYREGEPQGTTALRAACQPAGRAIRRLRPSEGLYGQAKAGLDVVALRACRRACRFVHWWLHRPTPSALPPGSLTIEKIRAKGLSWRDVFVEIPVAVSASHRHAWVAGQLERLAQHYSLGVGSLDCRRPLAGLVSLHRTLHPSCAGAQLADGCCAGGRDCAALGGHRTGLRAVRVG